MAEVSDERYAAVVRMRIREARLAKGLRQADIAALVGIEVREYQRLERYSASKRFNHNPDSAPFASRRVR